MSFHDKPIILISNYYFSDEDIYIISSMHQNEYIDTSLSRTIPPKRTSMFHLVTQNNRKTYHGTEHPSKRWGHSVIINKESMIIFGGRHSQRCLSNIYSLSFNTLTWAKIEQIGTSPPARDSHSAIMYNGEMIIFGGSGGGECKLNDLWSFNFYEKRWTKITTTGEGPSPCDGHLASVIYERYMMIYGGVNNTNEVVTMVYLLDLKTKNWIKVNCEGNELLYRDSQSCTIIQNTCYLFGGLGKHDELYNDMHVVDFDINELNKTYKIAISKEIVQGELLPPKRSSQSSVSYKNQYIFIIGGEGDLKVPLNDIWMYDILLKTYTKISTEQDVIFEGRFCHTAIFFNDTIAIYGGMQNAENTLDSLIILSFDENNIMNDNTALQSNLLMPNISIAPGSLLNNEMNMDTKIDNEQGDGHGVMTCVAVQAQYRQSLIQVIDEGNDTSDLNDQEAFSFEEMKKNYLNNLISWTFLKKLSEFNQWPIGCIGNFVNNTLKEYINARNLYIDAKCYFNDPNSIMTLEEMKSKTGELYQSKIVLSIIDDGIGISCSDFNQIMYSFAQNENKEYNYFQFGISMKTSALRLANSFLLISKTEHEVSIGIISKNLQSKVDSDLILTLIVNYKISKDEDNNVTYLPKSNFPRESTKMILEEIDFLFKTKEDLFAYFTSFQTGTHIFLYDLNQLSTQKSDLGQLNNYELYFDTDKGDILYNHFYREFGETNYIDGSLLQFLNFNQINHNQAMTISLFGKKLSLSNPLYSINQMTKNSKETLKLTSLKITEEDKVTDSIWLGGESYKGVLFNQKYLNSLINNSDYNIESITNDDLYNGVLLYKNNYLVSRIDQNKLGDVSYFIKKALKKEEGGNIFKINGYIELPLKGYDLTFSKNEIKDQSVFGFLYMKIKGLFKHIPKS